MRFLFVDRIIHVEKGKAIEGITTFSLRGEFLNDHFPKSPLIPGVLFAEAMAQVLGWLVIYSHEFRLFPVLTILEDVEVPAGLDPGFEARLQAEILSTSQTDSLGRAEVFVGNQCMARAHRLIFSHFKSQDPEALSGQFAALCQGNAGAAMSNQPNGYESRD